MREKREIDREGHMEEKDIYRCKDGRSEGRTEGEREMRREWKGRGRQRG